MGSPNVMRHNIAANAAASPVGTEVAAQIRGSYRGEGVKTSHLASKIVLENVTLRAVQRRRDLHTQMLRMLRKGQGANSEALSRIAGEYYEKLPDLPGKASLQTLVESMYALMKSSGPKSRAKTSEEKSRIEAKKKDRKKSSDDELELTESIFSLLQDFDEDVAHQFAGLEIVRDLLEEEDDADFVEALDRASQSYQEGDLGREVRAGLAVAVPAHAAAATLETNPGALRDAYRSMLREQNNFGQLFDSLAEFDMLKKLDETIDVFRETAGRELSSAGPSVDRGFLEALLTELGKLKQVQTVFDKISDAVTQTERAVYGDVGKVDVVQSTSRYLNFVSKPSVNLGDAQRALGGFANASEKGKVVYLNGLQVAHGLTPDAVMPSPQARLQQKAVLTSLSNQLVDAEERAYERVARKKGR